MTSPMWARINLNRRDNRAKARRDRMESRVGWAKAATQLGLMHKPAIRRAHAAGLRRTRRSTAQEDTANAWNKWRGPPCGGGGRLCRESPRFVLAPRAGGALSRYRRSERRVIAPGPPARAQMASAAFKTARPRFGAGRSSAIACATRKQKIDGRSGQSRP
jgi:hypothetical protein